MVEYGVEIIVITIILFLCLIFLLSLIVFVGWVVPFLRKKIRVEQGLPSEDVIETPEQGEYEIQEENNIEESIQNNNHFSQKLPRRNYPSSSDDGTIPLRTLPPVKKRQNRRMHKVEDLSKSALINSQIENEIEEREQREMIPNAQPVILGESLFSKKKKKNRKNKRKKPRENQMMELRNQNVNGSSPTSPLISQPQSNITQEIREIKQILEREDEEEDDINKLQNDIENFRSKKDAMASIIVGNGVDKVNLKVEDITVSEEIEDFDPTEYETEDAEILVSATETEEENKRKIVKKHKRSEKKELWVTKKDKKKRKGKKGKKKKRGKKRREQKYNMDYSLSTPQSERIEYKEPTAEPTFQVERTQDNNDINHQQINPAKRYLPNQLDFSLNSTVKTIAPPESQQPIQQNTIPMETNNFEDSGVEDRVAALIKRRKKTPEKKKTLVSTPRPTKIRKGPMMIEKAFFNEKYESVFLMNDYIRFGTKKIIMFNQVEGFSKITSRKPGYVKYQIVVDEEKFNFHISEEDSEKFLQVMTSRL